jgi:hypothetical protein
MFLVNFLKILIAHGCFNDFEYGPSYFTAHNFLIGYHYTIAKVLF